MTYKVVLSAICHICNVKMWSNNRALSESSLDTSFRCKTTRTTSAKRIVSYYIHYILIVIHVPTYLLRSLSHKVHKTTLFVARSTVSKASVRFIVL